MNSAFEIDVEVKTTKPVAEIFVTIEIKNDINIC